MTFRDLFGVELPIVQAPMAGVQGSALAIAVSRAGGLGSLPAAMLSAETLCREVLEIRRHGETRFNLNFFCHRPPVADPAREARWRERLAPYYAEFGIDPAAPVTGASRSPFSAESASLVEELKPTVVSFHFGLPEAALLARVRATGAKIVSSATTLDEARWLERKGVDAIIAQGSEAGGHRGMFLTEDLATQVGTEPLVRQLVRSVRVPIIAAGGIADAKGVAAMIALGALGVQVGTAYLLCPEATTSAVHRAALARPGPRDTVVTNIFSGRPARGIVNRAIREIGSMSDLAPSFPLASAAMSPLRAKAEARGLGDFTPLWSGQTSGGVVPVSAFDLTKALAKLI